MQGIVNHAIFHSSSASCLSEHLLPEQEPGNPGRYGRNNYRTLNSE
jgi:hypothetical protein